MAATVIDSQIKLRIVSIVRREEVSMPLPTRGIRAAAAYCKVYNAACRDAICHLNQCVKSDGYLFAAGGGDTFASMVLFSFFCDPQREASDALLQPMRR
jgi:hypothetical protein